MVTGGYQTIPFSNFTKGAISHFTLDLTDDAVTDPNSVTNVLTSVGYVVDPEEDLEFGDKDGIIGAVKFDFGFDSNNWWLSFDSNRAPVYGDFYIKDGVGAGASGIAYNTGFGDRDSEDIGDYIARPNSVTVPEPGILILLGLAMSAVGVAARFLRKI